MTATELLPCPFCGNVVKRYASRIGCKDSDCAGYLVAATPEEWNRRPQPGPQAMSAEEVREACAKVCDDKARESHLIGESESQKNNRKAWLDWESAEKGCALAIRSLDLSRKEKA